MTASGGGGQDRERVQVSEANGEGRGPSVRFVMMITDEDAVTVVSGVAKGGHTEPSASSKELPPEPEDILGTRLMVQAEEAKKYRPLINTRPSAAMESDALMLLLPMLQVESRGEVMVE